MEAAILNPDIQNNLKMLPKGFNKKKFTITYNVTTNPNLQEIQNLSKVQCLGKKKLAPNRYRQIMDDFFGNRHFYEVGRTGHGGFGTAGSL